MAAPPRILREPIRREPVGREPVGRESVGREPVGAEPQSPVRDDSKLSPTEDLDREPDGVPHAVVGLTALFSVMLAMLVAFMYLSGHTVGRIAAVALALIAIPTLVASLRKKAHRDRDHVHPSR